MVISENIKNLMKEIPEKVVIVAASKKRTLPEIKKAQEAGITDFGESRIHELEKKYTFFCSIGAKIHFIGHLQSAKARKAVKMADFIQSVDSIKLLEKLSRICIDEEKKQNVLLQVNIAGDKRYGLPPEKLEDVFSKEFPNVNITGLMAMAPNIEPEKTTPYFEKMKKLFDKYRPYGLEHLSCGMTNDFREAISSGANMIRIGRGIFEEGFIH